MHLGYLEDTEIVDVPRSSRLGIAFSRKHMAAICLWNVLMEYNTGHAEKFEKTCTH